MGSVSLNLDCSEQASWALLNHVSHSRHTADYQSQLSGTVVQYWQVRLNDCLSYTPFHAYPYLKYPRREHYIPVPYCNVHPRLDGYSIVMKGIVPSDILVGYCKGPNQSVPSNYVRKGKLLFLETSSNSMPISRSYKASDGRCLVYAQGILWSCLAWQELACLGSH